jgi:hypothetical protein
MCKLTAAANERHYRQIAAEQIWLERFGKDGTVNGEHRR